jgi:hypothetical protein
MKKFFLILISGIILCGCSFEEKDIYESYEHYSINSFDILSKEYYDDITGEIDTYVIAEIVPKNQTDSVLGLLYKISKDDYILLDILSNGSIIDKTAVFSTNRKLYTLGSNNVSGVYEYKLNGIKFEKHKLDLLFPENYFYYSIEIVDNEYLRFSGIIAGNNGATVDVLCSINNNICNFD